MQLRAGVIGHPIAHSKSPALHGAAYRQLGVDIDYRLVDVAPEELADFVERVRAAGDWAGLSVTMPHKAAMLSLVDSVDSDVSSVGVLNTVVVDRKHGGLAAANTDIVGIVDALGHAGISSVGKAAVLGGGATSRAALAALFRLGCKQATVYLRDTAKGADLMRFAEASALPLAVRPFEQLAGFDADLLISTLPPRAADPLVPGFEPDAIGVGKVLLDVAYDPWPSQLGSHWERSGGLVVSGLEMLLYQAVAQVAAFTGIELAGRKDVINVMCDSIDLPGR